MVIEPAMADVSAILRASAGAARTRRGAARYGSAPGLRSRDCSCRGQLAVVSVALLLEVDDVRTSRNENAAGYRRRKRNHERLPPDHEDGRKSARRRHTCALDYSS